MILHKAVALALVVCVLTPGAAWGGTVLDLDEGARSYPLGPYLEMLEDESGTLGLDDVRAGGRGRGFEPVRRQRLNLGLTSSVYWLRFRVERDRRSGARWLLELAAPVLDDVRVYYVTPRGVVGEQRAGDMSPFATRPYRHRNLVFPLPTTEPGILDVYVRVATEGAIILPLTLWAEPAFMRHDRNRLLLLGVYLGTLSTLLLYNLFIFIAVRDRSYLYYVLYLGGTALLQFTLNGLAAQFLWPAAGGAGNVTVLFFFGAAAAAGAAFARSFLGTATRQPGLHGLLGVMALAAAALAVGGASISYPIALRGVLLMTVGIMGVILVAAVRAYRQGYGPARFLLLAFAALVPGVVLYMARTVGWAPSNLLTDHAVELSTALEALLLSFGLADRINAAEAEKRRAERRAAEAREAFSQTLIRAQEADRRRIAGELHDSVGQALLVIHGRLRRLVGRDDAPSANAHVLRETAEMARQAIDETRSIARFLHPPQLERLGLAAAIRAMAERVLSGSGIELDCDIDETAGDRVVADDRIQLYRIAQEAVSNVARHSAARRCRVSLRQAADRLELLVEDDGVGIGSGGDGAPPAPGGFGLSGLRERARLLGGAVALRPRPHGGTELAVTIPLDGA